MSAMGQKRRHLALSVSVCGAWRKAARFATTSARDSPAAVATACALLPEHLLIARGKSFGGRMTSQAQARAPLQGVHGLAFLGFPLHPAGRPSQDRGAHLFDVQIPMLFLQGTRDSLASLDQIKSLCKKLGRRATLRLFADADHSFHVPARTGQKDSEVLCELVDTFAAWLESVIA